MFGFFSNKPSKQDAVSYCAALAKEARIDVFYENGYYGGFLIFLDEDGSSFVNHIVNHIGCTEAFIAGIEVRIHNGQYDDPMDDEMGRKMRELTGWKKNLNVFRAVMGPGNKPLLSWNLPKKS